jgi:hypothetical protein
MRDPSKIVISTKNSINEEKKIAKKNSAKIVYEEPTLEGITHYYIPIEKEDQRMSVFLSLYGRLCINKCLIYCSSQ